MNSLASFLCFVAERIPGNDPSFIDMLLGRGTPSSTQAQFVLVLAGMLLITKGGDIFTDAAVAIARATRIPPVIIGATIVSVSTTFPEFMVSLTGVLQHKPGIAVGNALGSCCCNIGLIVGTCAILNGLLARRRGTESGIPRTESGIPVSRVTLKGPGAFMLVSGVVVWVLCLFDRGDAESDYGIARWQAGLLLGILLGYLAYSLRTALQARFEATLSDDETEAEEEIREHIGKQVALFVVGAIFVVIGSRLMVANAAQIARSYGVSELIVGLTVLAVGTSLPEYTISLLAVIKGHGSLGIGNIFGANVLNICWVVATCAAIGPLPIEAQTVKLDAPAMLLLMTILIGLAWKNKRVSVRAGLILFVVYCGYLILATTLFAAAG